MAASSSGGSHGGGSQTRANFSRDWLQGIVDSAASKKLRSLKCLESCKGSGAESNGKGGGAEQQEEGLTAEEIVLGQVYSIHAENNRCVCHLRVSKELQNRYGTLHGGVIAMLVDVVGTAALLTVADPPGGVSTDINISYISSAKSEEVVEVEGLVLRVGRTLGVVEVSIRRLSTSELLAKGRHTKFLAVTPKGASKL